MVEDLATPVVVIGGSMFEAGAGNASEAAFPWIKRPTLVEEIAQVLRERIFSGVYTPGYQMLQVQLSEELAVSRTPLRHALNILEAEGLLQTAGARGVVVARHDLDDIEQAYLLREMVDGLAARLAASRPDAALISALEQIIEGQRQSLEPWRPDIYTRLNVEFHSRIMSSTDNAYLVAQLPLVRLTSQIFLPAFQLTERRAEDAVREHEGIVRVIASADQAGAEEVARDHIRRTIWQIRQLKKD